MRSDFDHLFIPGKGILHGAWLLARLLWNPEADVEALIVIPDLMLLSCLLQ